MSYINILQKQCNRFDNRRFFSNVFPKKTEQFLKEVKRKFCELRISSKSNCNSGDFFRSIFTFTNLLFKRLIWRSPTMLSIPKTVEIDARRNENEGNRLQVACRRCGWRFRNNRLVINHLQFFNAAPMDDEVGWPPSLAAVNEVEKSLWRWWCSNRAAVLLEKLTWKSSNWVSVTRKWCSVVKICLFYLKDQIAKITFKKSLSWSKNGW